MTVDSGLSKASRHAAELREEELEDQREANHQGSRSPHPRKHTVRAVPDLAQSNGVPMLLKARREVSHAEVSLVLITDQDYIDRVGLTPPLSRRDVSHGSERETLALCGAADNSCGFACPFRDRIVDCRYRVELTGEQAALDANLEL